MHLLLRTWLLALAVLAAQTPVRDYEARQYFAVEIDTSSLLEPLHEYTRATGFRFEHPVVGLDNHYVLSVPKTAKRLLAADAAHPLVRAVHPLEPHRLEKRRPVAHTRRFDAVDLLQLPIKEVAERLNITDPTFAEQWHLVNTQYPGNDVNVKDLWYAGINGTGVTVAVVDDGLDYESPDLAASFDARGLWDFNDNTALPKPRLVDDYHGTRCAAEIAATMNDFCGIGVAYGAKVAGIRILSGRITSADEAAAMVYGLDTNDIYSCLWGPRDDGRTVGAPSQLVKKAMVKGVQEGRGGKGAVYVFASGNGGRLGDQCNFDGYTNLMYSITVGAIDYKGKHPDYAEACSAVMVVTYSLGLGEHIHTTDIKNKCTASHGGTSAAAPLAAGIYALVLQANPSLLWRDVQYILALAADPVNEDDGEYQVTGLGRFYSHKYGYGRLDARKIVEFAKTWRGVKPQAWLYSPARLVNATIKTGREASQMVSDTVTISSDDMQRANIERVEHVQVLVDIELATRGKIGVRLHLPEGVVSDLAKFRMFDTVNTPLQGWTFMSVAHFGETGVGSWRLEVYSDRNNELTFVAWQLRIFGESIDPKRAVKFDVDKDYLEESEPEQPSSSHLLLPLATSLSTVVSLAASLSTEVSLATSLSTEVSLSAVMPASLFTSLGLLAPPTLLTSLASAPSPSATLSTPDEPAEFPISKSHVGLYFMGLAVVGFVIVLVMMKWHKTPGSSRRRRRDEYEFDIIPGEDYTDSDEDLLNLPRADIERERLYEEFNAETLPDYEDDLFQIVDKDDVEEETNGEGHTTKDKNDAEPRD